jgi:hypothetical protein
MTRFILAALMFASTPRCGATQSAPADVPSDSGATYAVHVARDSAVLVFPTPHWEQWTWYQKDDGYLWLAEWASRANGRRDRGLSLTVFPAPPGEGERSGTLLQLVRDGRRDALLLTTAGHLDAWQMRPEQALRAEVRPGVVVLVLGASNTLRELQRQRPDSMELWVWLLPVGVKQLRMVAVSYDESP